MTVWALPGYGLVTPGCPLVLRTPASLRSQRTAPRAQGHYRMELNCFATRFEAMMVF